jgi:MFS transporter, FSR family, fosmidomycin resistance protein
MSQATHILGANRVGDMRTIGVVSAAHFVSHYYVLMLPPLFAFVRADYGVSYTELGLALAAFNVVSAALQTPAGFLVDWLGARVILMIGLLLGAIAFAVVGLVDSFWVLVAMFGLAGVGNTAYHPANYALLSHRVSAERIGHAYSVHTFSGMLGSAAAPVSLLVMQSIWGWRGAFIGAAVLGLVVAAVIAFVRDDAPTITPPRAAKSDASDGWRLLFSAPILLNLVFFALLAMISGGWQNYSVVALGALHGISIVAANAALTGYLLFAAIGVLFGGVLAARTARHNLVAAGGLIITTAIAVMVAMLDLSTVLLVLTMSVAGLFTGLIMPSRDMIVREVTPHGSFGKVFGFVTTGFNIGGIVSPLLFGAVMDQGRPQLVFLGVAVFSAIAIGTVASGQKRPA